MHQETFRWNFRELGAGEPERLPRESEFFVGGDLDIPGSLVREIIQNSLDAGQAPPVRVCFAFVSQKNSEASRFYEGLLEHLRASRLLGSTAISNGSVRLLVAEDFNTSGLTGTTRRQEVVEDSASNYYNFWWREGVAQKRGIQGGRWGLGKVTFHLASKFRSIWGLTIRHDDRKALLLGKCLLKPHRYNGKLYDYYGYFSDGKYKPIQDRTFLEDFCRGFGITRQTEPGLSIVIPAVMDEVTPETTIRAAIMYYFLPIVKGELVVEVRSEDGSYTVIDGSNLREIVQAQSWEETPWRTRDISSLIDFIESIKYMEDTGTVTSLNVPPGDPRVSEAVFGDSLETLRNNFRGGQPVALQIPVVIRPVDGTSRDSSFNVFLKKDEGLEKAEEFYWRSGILIPHIRMLGRQRVRALLSAGDEAVSGFLGDSETPAHTDWNERTEDFKKKYRNAVATLRFIKGSIRETVKILDLPPAGRQIDFLKEIFHVKELAEATGRPIVKPPPPPPPLGPRLFEVSTIKGGFRVYLVDSQVNLPVQAEIVVAYDIRRGNPFKNYSPWDFDLSRMKRRISGGREISISDNRITVRIEKQNFKLEVKGFDPKRDVVVLTR